MTNNIIIQNAKVYQENKVLEKGCITLQYGKIISVTENPMELDTTSAQIIDGTGYSVIPGFIDTHIHGANGYDVMNATEDALDKMANILPCEGTTSFLATTVTQSKENIEKALINVAEYKNKVGNAEVLGVHLEGPFINVKKKGAQLEEYVIEPDMKLFEKWQEMAKGKIKTITVAPECDKKGTFIPYLVKSGVNVSAGHTNSKFKGIKDAVELGVNQLTHICNAMEGIHHRDVGAVGALFHIKTLNAELIADNIHVTPEMMQIIYNNVGSNRIILITDSMMAKYLSVGRYELGGQSVVVSEDRATLEDNDSILAGSILKMVDAVKNMLSLDGVSMKDAIQMASINPAKQIGVFDRKGSIAVGKDGDILLVDDNLNIKYTICNGTIAYKEN